MYIVYIKLQFFRIPMLQGMIVCGFIFIFQTTIVARRGYQTFEKN